MNIFDENSNIEKSKNTAVTIGTFDGIHRGHRRILDELLRISKEENSRNFVITFEPHPRTVVTQKYDIRLLTTLDEKKAIFEEYGIENLMVINFTEEFSKLTSEEFIRKFICDKIGARHVVIGYDHKFGRDRGGNETTLRTMGEKFGFDVTRVPPIKENGVVISSTLIRNLLLQGEVEQANTYLGRHYSLSGKVVHGAGRGVSLGFPTANLQPHSKQKLIPANGVYAVSVKLENKVYFGVMNIGFRPTFNQTPHAITEVHILDFNKEIYDENIKVEFVKRLRDEKKFGGKDELVKQIEDDIQKTKEILKEKVTN